MKISLNWLRQYIDLEGFAPEKIGEILTDLGLEVEGIEPFESLRGSLEGVVVGEVKVCEKHPNADKLSLTKVDAGGSELLQIVCGAPNVAAGQKVMVATIGATLYPVSGEPMTMKETKIRGELSQGMICAQDELGLGEDHSGILVLPAGTKTGTPAADFFKIEKDTVFEIGLTPNRSDATNHLGVARDLAASLKINFDKKGGLKLPDTSGFKIQSHDLPIEVKVENTEACPRYAGVCLKNIKVGDSPDWLKNRLKAIGVRPINNVVDITNFVLHEMGQPLHAFDYDKIAGQKVLVKTLPEGTKFLSLDEVERKLYGEDLMICDGDSKGMCIGGVFGGINSGVSENTVNIFLESAHFNPKYIRRSKIRHNLHTDAAFVFEKGSDPNICVEALKRAALLMRELAGATIASEVVDIYPEKIQPKTVEVKYAHVDRLIGASIPKPKIREILEALGMEYIGETEKNFTVVVPTSKADVTREPDVIEEIVRVFGLNNVPMPMQIRSSMVIGEKPDPQQVRRIISDMLAATGLNEMMALSLSESRYYRDILPVSEDELVFVNNTSNVQLDVMRPSMLFSGLEAILRNQNRQNADLKLFEFGKTYRRKSAETLSLDQITESTYLTIFLSGKRLPESWKNKSDADADYFTLKGFVENIFARLGLGGFQQTAVQSEVFQYALRLHRGEQILAEFGKVNPRIQKKMDIKNAVFYAELHWENILKALKKQKTTFSELNKFPGMRRDLALVVNSEIQFEAIAAIARKAGKKILKAVNLFDVFTDANKLGLGKKSYAVSFIFEDAEKTLNDKEVEKIVSQLIEEYEQKLGAVIRR